MNSIVENEGYPGVSVAVYYEGRLFYQQQTGFSDLASERAPDQKTIFRMYSLTKGVTQILAASLAEEGVLEMDAPISVYVAGLPDIFGNITARQLLDNRAGIRHYKSNQEWMELSQQHCDSTKDALAAFIDDPLIAEPGTKTAYSSFGYVLLSRVLESVSGQTFEQLMEERIWQPSQLERIELDDPQNRQFENVSTFYEPVGDSYVEAPFVDNSCKFGGGAINATPSAIAKIFSDYYQAKLTSKETLAEFVPAIASDQKSISLGGEGMGGRSALFAYPAKNIVVVIAANARGGDLKSYAENIANAVSQ